MKKKMFYGASNLIFQKAKYLRNHVTPSEMILWDTLKENFPEYRFRRQHPLSNYIADFYCHKLKLVIEVDGSIHDDLEVQKHDAEKESALRSFGLNIIRFTNEDIKLHIECCIETIKKHVMNSNNK